MSKYCDQKLNDQYNYILSSNSYEQAMIRTYKLRTAYAVSNWDFFINDMHIIPTAFELQYAAILLRQNTVKSGKQWFLDNIDKFQKLHFHANIAYLMYNHILGSSVKQQIIKIMENHIRLDKKKYENVVSYIKSIYSEIVVLPQLMSPQEIYSEYLKLYNNYINKNIDKSIDIKLSPWRSKSKFEHYVSTHSDIQNIKKAETQSFKLKENRKQFMLKCVSRRNTYMIDYVFFGEFYYMLAINVNTRKAYAIQGLGTYNKETATQAELRSTNKVKSNKYQSIAELNELLKKCHQISHLIFDGESSWNSADFKYYLKQHNIDYYVETKNKITNPNPNAKAENVDKTIHTTLSTLNRVCRTIRTMLYNMRIPQSQCSPNVMKYIIDEYNSSPHSTLSKIFHRKVCPNDIDYFMETVIINYMIEYNQNILNNSDYDIEVGSLVKVYNNGDIFEKVKPKVLAGNWIVKEYKGSNYVLENKLNNDKLVVPRWMICRA
jgi:hypothetical protein